MIRLPAAAFVIVFLLSVGAAGRAATNSGAADPLTFALPTGGTCSVTIAWNPADPFGLSDCLQQAQAASASGTAISVAPKEQCNATGNMSLYAGGYGDGLPATSAPLWEPYYLITDGQGALYISDGFDNRIRKVDRRQVMTTVAGSGPAFVGGYQGDGNPATCARLNIPMGIARDSAGDLYVSDWFDDVIRKIDTNGVISTVAGNSVLGYAGDGGPATAASLGDPFGVAVDSTGNLYIADTGNAVIRKVDTHGTITTIAGTGTSGYSGDGGPATKAQLYAPMSLRLDQSGNLYFAEYGNCVIRKINTAGIISTVAGNGRCGFSGDGGPATQAQLFGPADLSLDSAGNIYISDLVNFRIREVVAQTGAIQTVAGTGRQFGFTQTAGKATATDLLAVLGVAADNAGGFYFSDAFDVFHVDTRGYLSRVAGNNLSYTGDGRPAAIAELNQPQGVAAGGGNVYIADAQANRIRAVNTKTGVASTVAGTSYLGIPFASFGGDGGKATTAFLDHPGSVAADSAGNVYIADTGNDVIRKVNSRGIISTVAGTAPTCSTSFTCTRYPGFAGDGGPATSAQLNGPSAVAVDSAGNLYIADTSNNRIRKVSASGVITTLAGNGQAVCAFLSCVATGDGGPATSATLAAPGGIAVDPAGTVYIGDTADNVIRKVSPAGTISTVAGSGAPGGYTGDGQAAILASLQLPGGVATDGKGDLFIADTANAVVREVTPDGIIQTAVGSGPQVKTGHPNYPVPGYFGTYCGDRGSATGLCLAKPVAVAVDAKNNLYVADPNNARVWKVSAP
jgi:sugar lactone lactonase YvrE